jgi:hypothetical protein
VQDRVYQLQKADFNIENIRFRNGFGAYKPFLSKTKKNNMKDDSKKLLKSPYDDLAKHFEKILKANLASSKELVQSLDIISKIDKDPQQTAQDYQEFQDRRWLKELNGSEPISWSKLNKKQ